MSVTPRRVRQQETLVFANRPGKGFGALSVKNLFQRRLAVQLTRVGFNLGNKGIDGRRWWSNGSQFLGCAIDNDIANVSEQFLRAILFAKRIHQMGIGGNKTRIHNAVQKVRMSKHIEQETLVGLDTTNSEFSNGTFQLAGGVFASSGATGDLDKKGIVVWSNLGSGESRSVVKSDSHAARHTEHINRSSIGSKVLGWIFGGHTALHCKGIGFGDILLIQSKLFEGLAGSNHDLILDNVNAGNFFRDGVFHLYTGIDFHEIVIAAFVDQEFHRTSVSILGLGQESNGIR
mmetsp:Transcript_20320/g.43986  ORF Transcript_20320/g.43986 Transcript_20320/m.43986 type:complete len:289 (+) Transcript_20320:1975-2841(+)